MSEERETTDSGCEAEGGLNPVAVALALGGASREKADGFLDDQRALIADQRHHLHEQFKHLHLSVWEKQLGVLLRVATAVVGIAVAGFFGQMMWDAYRYHGLIVEAFSVPPDLAARGLTGEVVAARMLDKISKMEARVNTVRAQNSYINNWGKQLKVDIPETGISLDQLERYLRERLGNPTHISGDVVHMGTGISVTARVGTDAGKSFSGAESDFEDLLQSAAEMVYGSTQSYRYGIYLGQSGKIPESETFFAGIARNGPPSEQAWSYTGWYTALLGQRRPVEAIEKARVAVKLNPNFAFGWNHIGQSAEYMGRYEEALRGFRTALRLLDQHIANDTAAEAVPRFQQEEAFEIDNIVGDYAGAMAEVEKNPNYVGPNQTGTTRLNSFIVAQALIENHDLAGAQRFVSESPLAERDKPSFVFNMAWGRQDWPRVLEIARPDDRLIGSIGGSGGMTGTQSWPYIAFARAMAGNFTAAHALIDKTPADCDPCLRVRGRIDAAQKNYDGAAFWFARAADFSPSAPFGNADWGQMLLDRGDADGAIAKFAAANRTSPHFSDALEGWGEALMAKRDSSAAAKFEEAEKYAPNWGRLHLKWGEALVYAGNKDQAKAHFARAAQLDLTPSEKAELARMR